MASPTGSLFDLQSKRIEEIISHSIGVFMPTLDPIYEDTIVSNQGVQSNDLLGRNYEIYKVYMGGYSGVIDGAQPSSNFGLYGDANATYLGPKLYSQQAVQTFPSAEESPTAVPYVLKVPLRGFHTNLPLTLGELRAEQTPAFIGQIVAPRMKGFAQNMAHTMCNFWYISQNNSYSLGTCGSSGAIATDAGSPTTLYTMVTTPTNLAVHRFAVGQRVDVYRLSGTLPDLRCNDTTATIASQTPATRIPLYVVAVDEVVGTVTLGSTVSPASWTGVAIANGAALDGKVILHANCRLASGGTTTGFTGIAGMNSWMRFGTGTGNGNDNYLLGGEASGTVDNGIIDVTRHPEFKSWLKAIGGYLTEQTLIKAVHAFNMAKRRYGDKIDTLIASDGVWLGYEAQRIGMFRIDRSNRIANLEEQGLKDGFAITVDGQTVEARTSMYVESGVLYGIKKGENNFKRIVPPDPAGTQTDPNMKSNIPFRFVASALTGTSTSRMPVFRTASGGGNAVPTEMAQMPGMLYMQIVPERPAGLKLTGITEDRYFGDTTFSS